MKRYVFWPIISVLGVMVDQQVLAQTDASTRGDNGDNEAMVVTASRTNTTKEDSPQTVRIITKEEIAQQLNVTTDSSQVLSKLLPSYSPNRQKMTGSGETLRGRTPLFLVDGIPQSNPLRPTGRESHTIDFSQVEQIEVIHGANATNGVGAAGGVINIVTKRPEPGSFNQRFGVQMTTPTSELDDDTLSYKTTYGFSGNTGKYDYVFGLSYEQQGLYLDGKGNAVGVDNTQGDLMDSTSYDLLGKVAYWIDDDQRLQLSLNHYNIEGGNHYVSVSGDREAGIPSTSERGTPEGDAPYNEVWTSGLGYENYDLDGMQLSTQIYYQHYEALFGATDSDTFQDPSLASLGTYYDQSFAKTQKIGSKISLTKADLWDGRIKLTGGLDTLYDETEQSLYRSDRTYVPPSEYTDISPFLQVEFTPVDSLILSAGVRYEYAYLDIDSYQTLWAYNNVDVEGGNLSFDETLYNVGAVWKLVDRVSLFANYSEGFSIPDVGRALRSIDTAGESIDSIDNLAPIVTENIEVGVRYQGDRLAAELSYYESASDYGSRLTEEDGVFMMNRQATQITGIEASMNYAFTPRHSGRLAYSHMTGRYDSDDDGDLDSDLTGLNVSPDRLTASWTANWDGKWSTFLQADYAFDESYDVEDRDFDGYLLVDAAVGYRLPMGKLNLALSNLFDEQYITYYSQSALVSDDRYFAGRGRTLTLGYDVEF